MSPQSVPKSEWPAIFYSPHQDDEAIGMAGAIREHKEAGRPVFLVLLTNGANQALLDIMNGVTRCSWHATNHAFGLTMEQLIWARNVELIASANTLGVDKIFIVNSARGVDDTEAYSNPGSFTAKIADVIQDFANQYPGASHKLPAGPTDPSTTGKPNATHLCCYEAAYGLRDKITDLRFYRVYTYLKDVSQRDGLKVKLKDSWRDRKRKAINQYRYYLPEAGRYALGKHSVSGLLDSAYEDENEYIDLLPGEPG